jgi:hypothetical protein
VATTGAATHPASRLRPPIDSAIFNPVPRMQSHFRKKSWFADGKRVSTSEERQS